MSNNRYNKIKRCCELGGKHHCDLLEEYRSFDRHNVNYQKCTCCMHHLVALDSICIYCYAHGVAVGTIFKIRKQKNV